MSPTLDVPEEPGVGDPPSGPPVETEETGTSLPTPGSGPSANAPRALGQIPHMFSGVLDVIRNPIEQYRGEPYQGAFLAVVILLLLFFILFLATLWAEQIPLCWFFGISMGLSVWCLLFLFVFQPPPDRSLAAGQDLRAQEIGAAPLG